MKAILDPVGSHTDRNTTLSVTVFNTRINSDIYWTPARINQEILVVNIRPLNMFNHVFITLEMFHKQALCSI